MGQLIGRDADQVPLNQYLGTGAFKDITPTATLTELNTGTEPLPRVISPATLKSYVTTNVIANSEAAFPSIGPSLLLDFANSEQVDPRITFTRATTATRTNKHGLIETVAAGVPRIDYDPITGECKGLLIEEQRTNLLTYSEQFDDVTWSKHNATVTANVVTAPDGTMTADKIDETTYENSYSSIAKNPTFQVNTTYTFSVFVKAAERTKVSVSFSAMPGTYIIFDTVSKSFTSVGNLVTSTGDAKSSNGWYRIWFTFTTPSSGVNLLYHIIGPTSTDNTGLRAGTAGNGIYIWGAQLEVGAFPTSYIPTVNTSITRNADAASMTGTNFSSWFRSDEGTLFAHYSRYVAADSQNSMYAFGLSNNSYTDIIGLRNNYGSAELFSVVKDNVSQVNINLGTARTEPAVKKVGAYKLNSFQGAVDGVLGIEDVSGAIPPVDRAGIGCYMLAGVTAEHLNGHIRSLAYYPKRLSNSELMALTS